MLVGSKIPKSALHVPFYAHFVKSILSELSLTTMPLAPFFWALVVMNNDDWEHLQAISTPTTPFDRFWSPRASKVA